MLKRKQSKVYTLKRRGGTRACGECTACCTTLRVDALDKPPGTPCVHLGEARCGIYAGRPEECAAFQCCWLAKDPTLPASARPDRVGFVAYHSAVKAPGMDEPEPALYLWETNPEGLKHPAAKGMADAYRRVFHVVFIAADGTKTIQEPLQEACRR